jgi:ethanolamine utilization cobalamin adenosyltransferase
LQIGKQVGAAVASAFQLTTHPNVSQLCAAISKNPAARALLSELELSPTALHYAEEQCRLSIQAQEDDKKVKQADVQSPKKVGTRVEEIPVTSPETSLSNEQ